MASFTAAQYLAISDRIVEKAAPCSDLATMVNLLTRANLLWRRAKQLEPPTSEWLMPSEVERLRRHSRATQQYCQLVFVQTPRYCDRPMTPVVSDGTDQ